jgi:hypothetical protein
MAGEFLSQDYLNAASNFGNNLGNLGNGVLSTLGGAASTATNVVGSTLGTAYDYGAGTSNYLTNMVQPSQSQQTVYKQNNFTVPDLGSFGQSFNMNSLTSGLSSMKSPDILGTLGGAGNALANTGSGLLNTGGSLLNTGLSNGSSLVNSLLSSPQQQTQSQQQQTQSQQQQTQSSQNMQNQYNNMVSSAASSSPLSLLSPITTIGGSLLSGASSKLQNYGSSLVAPAMLTEVLAPTSSKQSQLPSFDSGKAQNVAESAQGQQSSIFSNGMNLDAVAKSVNDIFGFGKSKTEEVKSDKPIIKKRENENENDDVIFTSNAKGGADYTNKQVSTVPLVNGKPINQPIDSQGRVIPIGESISKPDEEFMKNDSRWFSDIGDQPARDLVNTEVTDTWSAKEPIKYKITSLEEALEYRKQAALHGLLGDDAQSRGISTRDLADFYQNELDKSMQNRITLSSSFHHATSDAGVSVERNPWENAGDAALGFLKGGGRDNFTSNYNFNPDVVGKLALTSLLPGGLGLNETRWSAAASPDNMKDILSANFRPAIMKVLGSESSTGPYGSLSGRGSDQDITALPKAYQDVLSKIAKGETQKQTVSQTALDESGKPITELDKNGFMRGVFKTVDVTRPTSYEIPSSIDLVPESAKGIVNFEGTKVSKIVAGSPTIEDIDKAPEVKIYVPDGKGKQQEIIAKVIINADTGEQTYYQRHVDPSTGQYMRSYQPVGGAGQYSAQSGEFQFGTPIVSTVTNQLGQLIDTSKFNTSQSQYTPNQQATINAAIEKIFVSGTNTDKDKQFTLDQEAGTAYNQLKTMGISSDKVDALYNARVSGEVPTSGYSNLNLANFVSADGAKPKISVPWVFPEETTSPVLITGNKSLQGGDKLSYEYDNKPGYAVRNLVAFTNDIKNDYNNLGDLSVPGTNLDYTPKGGNNDTVKFANTFSLPNINIPLSTGQSDLLNKDLGGGSKIVGGEIVRPAGYTGTPATRQLLPEMVITPGTMPGTSKGQQETISTALEQLKQNPVDSSAYNVYKNQLLGMGVGDNQITNALGLMKSNQQLSTDEAAKSLVYSATSLSPVNTTVTQTESKAGGNFPIASLIPTIGLTENVAQSTEPNNNLFGNLMGFLVPKTGSTQSNLAESARSLFASTPLGATLIGTPEEKAKGEQTRQKIDQYTNVLGVGMIGGPSTASKALTGTEMFSSSATPALERIALTTKGAAPPLSEVRVPGISDLVYKSQTPLGSVPLKSQNLYDVGTGAMAAKAATTNGKDQSFADTFGDALISSIFPAVPLVKAAQTSMERNIQTGNVPEFMKPQTEEQKAADKAAMESGDWNKMLGTYTKKVLPSYENMGVGLLKYGDVGVEKLSEAEKSAGITPLYEKEKATDLLPSQRFLAYARPEGFTKTVYESNQPGALGTSVTTKGIDETTPEGAGIRFTQSAIRGAFEMPREKPVDTAMWLAMPGVFKAGEGALGYGVSRVAPTALTNPWVLTGAGALKTGLMGTFIGSEGAKVGGYDVNPFNVLSGKPLIERTIVGYEADGKTPIYAAQTPTGYGERTGELVAGLGAMSAGSSMVEPFKFEYTNKIPPRDATPAEKIAQSLSGKTQALETKAYTKLDESLKALRAPGQRTVTGRISGAIEGFKGAGDENAAIQSRLGEFGTVPEPRAGIQPTTLGPDGKPAQPNLLFTEVESGIRTALNRVMSTPEKGDVIVEKGSFARQGDFNARPTNDFDAYTNNPVKFANRVASSFQDTLGIKNAKVSVEYPDGYKFDAQQLGPRNPVNFNFRVTGELEGKPVNSVFKPPVDVKTWGADKPLMREGITQESRYNWRSMFTPGEERNDPNQFLNNLFLTNNNMKVVRPNVGQALFGAIGMRPTTTKDYTTPSDKYKLQNPYANKNVVETSEKPVPMTNIETTFNDKVNNIATTLRTVQSGNAGKEAEKLGKSFSDLTRLTDAKEMNLKTSVNKGTVSDKDAEFERLQIQRMRDLISDLGDRSIKVRYTPKSEVETVPIKNLIGDYDAKVAEKLDLYKNPYKNPPMNLAKVDQATPARWYGSVKSTPSSTGHSSGTKILKPIVGYASQKDEESSFPSPFKSSPPPLPSSGISSDTTKSPSGSGSSGSKSDDKSSGGSSGSSSSNSYSSSSVSSPSSSSSSQSSQSSSDMSSSGGTGSYIYGSPFLASAGGGGGGGGGGGHLNAIIRNPLAALSVAGSGKQFMKFGDVNKYVRSVKGNTGGINPNIIGLLQTPVQAENTASMSKGAKSSLEEATSIYPIRGSPQKVSAVARKSKKQKVKAKRKISIPQITTPHINLNANVKGDLAVKSKKKSKKGRK